jgi:hypothetical protein
MAYNILIHAKIYTKRTNRLLACTGDSSASALKLELGRAFLNVLHLFAYITKALKK